jgi:S-adenosylmethionine:tRNA ribosyltransferase-isomerase
MRTDLFDYMLPAGLIAQRPLPERDSSRLMVLERRSGNVSHRRFEELPSFLDPGDLLVVNNTRVFPGRLGARKKPTGGFVELLLLEKTGEGTWAAMTRGARLRPATRLSFQGTDLSAVVVEGPSEGRIRVRFEKAGAPADDESVFELGRVPLPPYTATELEDPERYQTVYAERRTSAAAPTAGLHFTERLLAELSRRGIEVASLELSVGMDTFVPVREERVEEHRMHSERFVVPVDCADAVNAARRRGGRVTAVGTTVVRALESASQDDGTVEPLAGSTELFITPGYRFRAVDSLLTNFHFPRSTLLMLVCAFGGTELILDAYRTAVSERYRFYSFGDAMLVF